MRLPLIHIPERLLRGEILLKIELTASLEEEHAAHRLAAGEDRRASAVKLCKRFSSVDCAH